MTTYARVLSDKYWWHLRRKLDGVPFEVKVSRHEFFEASGLFGAGYPYPAPIELFREPLSGGTDWEITDEWWAYVQDINTPEAWWALRRNDGGWINAANNDEWPTGSIVPQNPTPMPRIEGITSVGNIHRIHAEHNGKISLHTFKLSEGPPLVSQVNPKTHPWLFCKFTSISKEGAIGNAPNGILSYFPLVTKNGYGYLPRQALEMGVELPEQETTVTDPILGYTKGKDFSHHATFHNPGVATDDTEFAILKGSEGTWNDPRTAPGGDLYESIANYEVRGVYHYHRSAVGWKRQADSLLFQLEDPYFHFGNWDYERRNNTMGQAFADACQMAMEYLVARSEKKILLYSNVRGFNDDLRPYDPSTNKWYNDHLLWIAQWPWKQWIDKESKYEPTFPKGVDHWEIWQYGADSWNCYGYKEAYLYGLGKDSVDLNYFPGSLDYMKSFFSITPPTLPDDDTYRQGQLDMATQNLADINERIEELG